MSHPDDGEDAPSRGRGFAGWTGFGVRWRLLLAFLGISAFAVLSAAAAMYSFREVGTALDRITEERIPSALISLQLSRQAERIVRSAPALLTVTTTDEWHRVQRGIADEVGQLDRLLDDLRDQAGGSRTGFVAEIEPLLTRFEVNLQGLNTLVGNRLAVAGAREGRLRQLANTTVAARRLVGPSLLVMDSELAEWSARLAPSGPGGAEGGDGGAGLRELLGLASSIIGAVRQQKLESTIITVNDYLIRAATSPDINEIAVLSFPLNRALEDLERDVEALPAMLRSRAERVVSAYRRFGHGDLALPRLRVIELSLIRNANFVLGEIGQLSQEMTAATDRLVASADRDIEVATREARTTQSVSRAVLVGMVVLSLGSSGLIVWRYVDRSLVARLRALSDSMAAIAGGNLRADLPPAGHSDEIDRMGRALVVFRDTAIEIEEKNLREVAQARQQLIAAIESISEGFALYDENDRLVLCNSRYRDDLLAGMDDIVAPGVDFETVIREAVRRGLVDGTPEELERWTEHRLAHHRHPTDEAITRRTKGRFIRINERKTDDGCTVAVHADVTELKRREEALEAEQLRVARANRQIVESINYASRIQAVILPTPDVMAGAAPAHFVIWEPRDIVGGDFYWCRRAGDGHILMVGDCTGHGVPGAFMTLIVTGLLDDIVRDDPDIAPARLLVTLHARLKAILGKGARGGYSYDGLEAGLCRIGGARDRMVYAGSRLTLWCAQAGEITEVRGDRPVIGQWEYPDGMNFAEISIPINRGDCFYLATDGLTDQIGCKTGRAFGKRRLRDFLARHHMQTMNRQESTLRSLFLDHQGRQVRRDDVTVVGFAPAGLA
jgi:serine phosphatase RsbU (regulator of sigma subunit)